MLLVQLDKTSLTDINDFITVIDLKLLFRDGGSFPFNIMVSVGFVHIDDVFSKFHHFQINIKDRNVAYNSHMYTVFNAILFRKYFGID